jgi:hypothetical protein
MGGMADGTKKKRGLPKEASFLFSDLAPLRLRLHLKFIY